MRESNRIRLMKLSERLGKGRIRVKEMPPKTSCIVCEEVSQGVIDELVELQVDAKKRKQVLEFYYDLVLQNHVADPRTEEELKEYYRALALDNTLDPIVRANCVKYFLALKHHLFQERVLKSQHYPCNNYHHSYIYVGGTATRLDFKCKYCGKVVTSTSAEYLDAEKRRWAIKRFTGERDADEVVTAEPPKECLHDWHYTGGRHDAIYIQCTQCGEKIILVSPNLKDKSYRAKEISRYDKRMLLNIVDSHTKVCDHQWTKIEEHKEGTQYECDKCGALKTEFRGIGASR